MTVAIAIIASCIIGAAIIEIRAHCLLRMAIHRRVMALFADDRAQRRAEQSNSDYRKQNRIHLVSPLRAFGTREAA